MFALFIDTTQTWCNLAILKDKQIVNKFKVKTNNNLTEIVVEHIESLLTKTNLKHSDIKKILLVIGPGSFTGVRIGTLIAKTWALTQDVNIYTIDALLLQTPQGNGLSLLDARGDLVFIALYKNNKCLIKPKMIKETEAEPLIKKYKTLGIYIQYKSVDIFSNLIYHLNHFKKVTNIHRLNPLYIKKPV